MPSTNMSEGQPTSVRAALYLTVLSLVALCITVLCTVGLARVAATTEAGLKVPAAAPSPGMHNARSLGRRLNQAANSNSGENTNGGGQAATPSPSQTSTPSPTPVASPTQKSGDDKSGDTASVCKDVTLGPARKSAKELAAELDKTPGVTVKELDDRVLLLCGPPRTVDALKATVQKITGGAPDHGVHETHYVRLFFLRKAGDIADAINKSGRLSSQVKALGDDLLVFPSESDADDEAIHQFKRWMSVVDVPRPEVSLMTWSVQVSSGDKDTVNRESARIRSAVSGFNDRLQSALEQGWWYLEGSRRKYGDNFYAKNLSSYVSNRYLWTKPGTPLPNNGPKPPCGTDQYCLGYTRIFKPIQPSLTSMLLALIAAQPGSYDEAMMTKLRNDFVDCLENRQSCQMHYDAVQALNLNPGEMQGRQPPRPLRPLGYHVVTDVDQQNIQNQQNDQSQNRRLRQETASASESNSCESEDDILLDSALNGEQPGPAFYCFREQLHRSLGSGHLAEIRRSLADFLFQYKSAEYYPQDFIAWNQTASSQALDTQLDPLIVAFNRDLNVYLRHIQGKVQLDHKEEKKATFVSDGIVTARVISGNAAKVETTTQSFFKQPPTLNVRDVISALASNPSLAPIASGNGAELIAAAVKAEQRMVARVGRNLNINVTSNTLKGASACEMDVELDSAEADKPSMLNTTAGTSADDNLSRVAIHNTNTKVRVDSTKLFEVSSFAAALVHGRSIPLVPPGVDIPYIGSIARLRLKPGTVYHRSFAIVSAVIVPTAADLANMIEFGADLEEVPTTHSEVQLLSHATPTPTPSTEQQQTPQQQRTCQPRQGHRKCPNATASPAQASPAKVPEPTATVYYWIVAHYRDGDSVSGPFRVSNAAAASKNGPPLINDDHPITLLWRAPESALSFDVIRADDSTSLANAGGKTLLAVNLVGSAFVDVNDNSTAKPYAPADYQNGNLSRTVFSRITRTAGNLRVFHKAMLDCIEAEASGTPCTDVKLSDFPPEGGSQ